jgi:hypothetical protein
MNLKLKKTHSRWNISSTEINILYFELQLIQILNHDWTPLIYLIKYFHPDQRNCMKLSIIFFSITCVLINKKKTLHENPQQVKYILYRNKHFVFWIAINTNIKSWLNIHKLCIQFIMLHTSSLPSEKMLQCVYSINN